MLSGCATPQSATRTPLASGDSVCWEPPPQKATRTVFDWCKEHPVAVGVTAAVLVVGGLLVASVASSIHNQSGSIYHIQ
jgi:hypothetical protein